MNLLENLKLLLQEATSYIDTPEETDKGILVIPVKREIIVSADSFSSFYRMFMSLQRKLGLETYIKMVIGDGDVEAWHTLTFQVDISGLHRDRLLSFFHPDVTKDQAKESIDYLFGHQWNEEQIQREIGISQITLYRYKTGNFRQPTENPN